MKNLKIKTKLTTLVIFLLVALVAVGGLSIVKMASVNESSTILADNWMPSVISAEEINTMSSDYRINEYKHIISEDPQEMAQFEKDMEDKKAGLEAQIKTYEGLISTDTDKQLIETISSEWKEYLKIHDEMIKYSTDGQTQQAMQIMAAESKEKFDTLSSTCLELVEFNKSNGEKASTDGDATYASARTMMIAGIVVVAVLAVIVALYIIRSITKPVKEIDDVAVKIADGKLDETIHYQSKDELGRLAVNFNKTVTRLRDYVNYIDEISNVLNEISKGNLVFQLTYDYAGEFAKVKQALENISESLNDTMGQINSSADQVASGSEQVSVGAQALSQGATEQASSVEELAATINEISNQIKDTAGNAADASTKAGQVGDEANESNTRMKEMLSAMGDISSSSSEIAKIIKDIEDIAFQTNILALNAAVEARPCRGSRKRLCSRCR